MNTKAERYAAFFERLTPDTPSEAFAEIFEPDAYFEDPFHRAKGVPAIRAVFEKMYRTLHAPAFSVDEIIEKDSVAYLRWEFSYRRAHDAPVDYFEGVSRVQFSENGRATSHIDYWDAARHVFARMPILGRLLRFLTRRIGSL